jgi:DNA-binding PadR family transcriptional regulator
MPFRHGLLGLLADGPKTGYELTKVFADTLEYVWPAGHSQIYPELGRLAEQGLIQRAGDGARGSKRYELTPAGLAELRRWFRETNPSRRIRNEPLLRVFFLWVLDPEEAEAYLRREADEYRRQLEEFLEFEHRDRRTPSERASRLALEAGIRVLRARLEWAEWAQREVRSWKSKRSADRS